MHNKNISPVGWYIASYLIRFVELDNPENEDLESEFTGWENTILVKANNLEEAYEKVIKHSKDCTKPYKGGPNGVDVRWVFEGVTELLPVYEEFEDGAEIMYREHNQMKLKHLRKLVRQKSEFYE